MKKSLLLLSVAALPLIFSCSSEMTEEMPGQPSVTEKPSVNAIDESLFPADATGKRLNHKPVMALRQLMLKFDESKALVMGETQITDEQFAEIKAFVDENLKQSTKRATYEKIFDWVTKNIRYAGANDTPYLDPYDVFKYKTCVCQGFSNLMKTMCITQDIPAIVVNGFLVGVGGHAWNYIYTGKEWMVCDATNKQSYRMMDHASYRNSLDPRRTDLLLFEDDNFGYNFEDGHLNLATIKPNGKPYITVPNSVSGYQITSFRPTDKIDASFTQLYLGKNIEKLGDEPSLVSDRCPSLKEIYVAEGNKFLSSYKNILYLDGSDVPYFIPSATHRVELKPMKVVDKGTIYNLPNVEEIVVGEGTERIEDYAIEMCPNLRTLYIPTTVEHMGEEAIYRCNENVEIVRMPTGIPEITM